MIITINAEAAAHGLFEGSFTDKLLFIDVFCSRLEGMKSSHKKEYKQFIQDLEKFLHPDTLKILKEIVKGV